MSWLPIVICLAALALILGPVMLMQPTPAQRRELELRNKAADLGLRVHFQPIPEGSDFKSRNNQAVTYCFPWSNQADIKNQWLLVRKSFDHDLHFDQCWDWLKEPTTSMDDKYDALRALLNDVPEFVFALSSGPQGLCMFWGELGKEADVLAIGRWLETAAPTLSLE